MIIVQYSVRLDKTLLSVVDFGHVTIEGVSDSLGSVTITGSQVAYSSKVYAGVVETFNVDYLASIVINTVVKGLVKEELEGILTYSITAVNRSKIRPFFI